MAERTDRSALEVEFTHRWYENFLDRLRRRGYTFGDFTGTPDDGEVLLRHDVDLSLEAALEMARIEADRGVHATYFVLLTSTLYNPLAGDQRRTIEEIGSLGHDVSLHFSTHEYRDRDVRPGVIEDRVGDELAVLRTLVPASATVSTVSFHIPPAWVQGRSFEGFKSAYEPAFFEDIAYVADSTQRWRREPPTLDGPPTATQVLTHPGLWGDEDGDFESRVERAIGDACDRTSLVARREFLQGVEG